jgi:hypothetical protein
MKLFEITTTIEIFEPKIKTLVPTKLFVKNKNLIQTPRIKTKTSNIATAKSA